MSQRTYRQEKRPILPEVVALMIALLFFLGTAEFINFIDRLYQQAK